MSNLNNNTTQLEEILAKVNALPEAGGGEGGVGISNAAINDSGHLIITYTNGSSVDVGKIVGENATTTAVATSSANGLMSAADKQSLDAAIDYDGQNDGLYVKADVVSAYDAFELYIGDTHEFVYISDGEGGYVDMQQLFSSLREAGILSSTYGLRRNRSTNETTEPSGEASET